MMDCVGGSFGANTDELAAERFYDTASSAVIGFEKEISELL
jgi:hypothetical protein